MSERPPGSPSATPRSQSSRGGDTFRIPDAFLDGTKDSGNKDGESVPETQGQRHEEAGVPLIMFINSSSGGHVGPTLAKKFAEVVGFDQVFDLSKQKPGDVLSKLYENLSTAEQKGDQRASRVRHRLRVLACGGDGTVAWILTTIWKLDLKPPPPVGVIPLGTGNGLSINFGWGKTMRAEWLQSKESMHQELQALVKADQRDIDLWKIGFESDTVKFDTDERPDALTIEGATEAKPRGMRGMYTYYFSFGVDAEVAYRFHELRKHRPKIASKRKVNETLYAGMGVRTGWFCGAQPLRKSIAKIQVKKQGKDWEELKLKSNIFAIVILNLQTYSGGRDIWGLHDDDDEARRPEEIQKEFHKPIFYDGLIEVVGLKNGWNTCAVLAQINRRIHGKRCGQGHEVMIEFTTPSHGMAAFMRLDGEPWMQDLSGTSPDKPLRVHIRHAGKSSMMLNTASLPGTAQRALKLAEREHQLSNQHPTTSREVTKSPTVTSG